MLEQTDLNGIRNMAIALLYLDIKTDTTFSFICYHPFLNSPYGINQSKKMVNYTDDIAALSYWRTVKEKEINNSNLIQIYNMIDNRYKLTFIKYTKEFLSLEDFSVLLADAWVSEENPNMDINCPLREVVKWFKQADKNHLMNSSDYKVYTTLPLEFDVYRGVANGRNPNGISWTRDYNLASWFAHRFDTEEKVGYIQKATVKKEDVLAYFNGRNENEIIVKVPNKLITILEKDL